MKRCTKELEQLKHLSLKINKVTSKDVTIIAPDIGFTDEPVVQCDVPVVKDTFVDDRK